MNMLSRLTSFLKRVQYGTNSDPVRDWLVILTFFGIALAGVIVWNVWAFDTVANGGGIGTPGPTTYVLFNRDSLDSIHTIFTNRAAEETKYVNGVYRYADPSQ